MAYGQGRVKGDNCPGPSAPSRRVARGGDFPPQFRELHQKFSGLSGVLMCKPKKYFSANHRKCLRNLLHNFVEPDEGTKVHQLSTIKQTLGTWASENFIQGGQY